MVIPPHYQKALEKGQQLGLFDEHLMHTKFFIELSDNAVNDLNKDPQFRDKILRKMSHPLFYQIALHFGPKLVERTTLHCIIGSRMCELIGETADKNFVNFICLYLLNLEDLGLLKVFKVPKRVAGT